MAEQLQPDLTVKTIADFLQTVINYYAGFNFIQKVFHYQKAKRDGAGNLITSIGWNEMPSLEVFRIRSNFVNKVFDSTDDDCNIMIRIQIAEPIPENMSKKLNTLSKAIAIWLERGHDPNYMNDLKIQNIANLGRHGKIIANETLYHTEESENKALGVITSGVLARETLLTYDDSYIQSFLETIGFVFNPNDPHRPFKEDNITPDSEQEHGSINELEESVT